MTTVSVPSLSLSLSRACAVLTSPIGRFEWDGVNFTESAQNISFKIEGGGAVPVLRAELRNAEGNYQGADVNLSERVENENGNLVFI